MIKERYGMTATAVFWQVPDNLPQEKQAELLALQRIHERTEKNHTYQRSGALLEHRRKSKLRPTFCKIERKFCIAYYCRLSCNNSALQRTD
jgi:hypothetical protein